MTITQDRARFSIGDLDLARDDYETITVRRCPSRSAPVSVASGSVVTSTRRPWPRSATRC